MRPIDHKTAYFNCLESRLAQFYDDEGRDPDRDEVEEAADAAWGDAEDVMAWQQEWADAQREAMEGR